MPTIRCWIRSNLQLPLSSQLLLTYINIMQLLKKVSAVRKNIHFQSLLGNGVMAILGMLTIAILYRGLSVKDIGIYIFFLTILNLVDTLRSGFLTTAFIKFYSGTNEDRASGGNFLGEFFD